MPRSFPGTFAVVTLHGLRYVACVVCVTIYSIGRKFCPILNSMELNAFTLASCFLCSLALCYYSSYLEE